MFGSDRPRELLDMDGLPLPTRPVHRPICIAEVRELVQAAVKAHRLVFDYWGKPVGCDCSLNEDMTEAEHAKHFTNVLMNLPGITIRLT